MKARGLAGLSVLGAELTLSALLVLSIPCVAHADAAAVDGVTADECVAITASESQPVADEDDQERELDVTHDDDSLNEVDGATAPTTDDADVVEGEQESPSVPTQEGQAVVSDDEPEPVEGEGLDEDATGQDADTLPEEGDLPATDAEAPQAEGPASEQPVEDVEAADAEQVQVDAAGTTPPAVDDEAADAPVTESAQSGAEADVAPVPAVAAAPSAQDTSSGEAAPAPVANAVAKRQTGPAKAPAVKTTAAKKASTGKSSAKATKGAATKKASAKRATTAKQLVKNGSYVIRMGKGNSLVLDIAGTVAKGTNVIQATYKGGVSQAWQVLFDKARGLYKIFRKDASGRRLVLDAANGKTANGTNLRLWTDNGTDAQWWKLVKWGSGFRIVSSISATSVLDVKGGSTQSGANVQLWRDNGSAAQRVYLHTTKPSVTKGERVIADGTYEIVASTGTGKTVFDVKGGSLASGANIRLCNANKTIAQRFHLAYNKAGYYEVVAVGSGRSLAAQGSGLLPGTNAQQATTTGSAAQRWVISKNANGTYTFTNMANGLVLDIAGGSARSGANLQLYTSNKTAAQQFRLRSIDMLPTGLFTIKSLSAPSQVLDITNGSNTSGAGAQLYRSNGSLAQKYEIQRVGKDQYRIRTAASGGWLTASGTGAQVTQQGSHATAVSSANTWKATWKGGHMVLVNKANGSALTLQGGSTANRTKLVTAQATGNAAQQFTVTPTELLEAGCYFFQSGKGTYLDVAKASNNDGANVMAWEKDGSISQWFYLERNGSVYRIKNAHSEKYLAAMGTGKGANVVQQSFSSSDLQRWHAKIADGGRVSFANVSSGMVIDIAGGSASNGANVQTYTNNGSAAQAWKLIKSVYMPYDDDEMRAINRVSAEGSYTNYAIAVDRDRCLVIVMERDGGTWRPIREMVCSPGAPNTPTVSGSFTVGDRGYSFGSGYTCYYWTQFYQDYLFHSVLYYEGTRTIQDGRLGYHISHGCVRMDIDDAYWINANIPSGTRVVVY